MRSLGATPHRTLRLSTRIVRGAESIRRTSVLFVIPSLQGGGAERVVVTLLRHLDRTHLDLALAVLDNRNPAYAADLPPGIEIIDLRLRRVRYGLPHLVRLIRRRRPDAVFSVIGHLNLGVALLKPLLPKGVRLFGRETAAVSRVSHPDGQGLLWRMAYRHLYRRFDQVICQSEDMRRALVDHFGLPCERARVIRNPLDIERVRALADERLRDEPWGHHAIRLISVGRLSYEKGLDILLEAIGLLADQRIHLTILGDGQLRGSLEKLARDLGISDRVRFLGFVPNPYMYMAQASALVLSSRFEAYPNVVLEALACGTPVIATPAPGGIVEIAHEQPGCVLAGDISGPSLARAIAEYPFGDGRSRVVPDLESYAAKRISAQYEALFSWGAE